MLPAAWVAQPRQPRSVRRHACGALAGCRLVLSWPPAHILSQMHVLGLAGHRHPDYHDAFRME